MSKVVHNVAEMRMSKMFTSLPRCMHTYPSDWKREFRSRYYVESPNTADTRMYVTLACMSHTVQLHCKDHYNNADS